MSESELILELHESKSGRNVEKRAAKELKEKLLPCSSGRVKGRRVSEVKSFGAKLVLKCTA